MYELYASIDNHTTIVTLKQNHQVTNPGDDLKGLGNVACLPLLHSSGDTTISMWLLLKHRQVRSVHNENWNFCETLQQAHGWITQLANDEMQILTNK